MFKFTDMKKVNKLEVMIDRAEKELMEAKTSEDRQRALTLLKELKKIQIEDKKVNKMNVSGDTLVTCGTSLASVLLMLNFEKLGVIRSKAIGFIMKGKI